MDIAEVEKNIKKAIDIFIREQEGMGDQSVGSGHLATISVQLENIVISPENKQSYNYRVELIYTKTIETEFTYYPDNPPQIYTYEQIVFIDANYSVVGFNKKQLKSSNWDIDLLFDD